MDVQLLIEKFDRLDFNEKYLGFNYRKTPPVSSLREIGEIFYDRKSNDGKWTKQTSFIKPHQVMELLYSHANWQCVLIDWDDHDEEDEDWLDHHEVTISDSQIQKLLDYVSLEDILDIVAYRAGLSYGKRGEEWIEEQMGEYEGSQPQQMERSEEEQMEEWEEEHKEQQLDLFERSHDPWTGEYYEITDDDYDEITDDDYDEITDDDYDDYDYPDNDYSSPAELYEQQLQYEADKKIRASYQMAYHYILSLEWFKNYRKTPPASSFQELGDFSSYDEFENKINSLIVDLFNKNNFQPAPHQKLFDFLSLAKIFKLIVNVVRSIQPNFAKLKLRLEERDFLKG